MRTALTVVALITLASTAQAQITCQQVGDNMICSDGTVICGARSPFGYTPAPPTGGFGFGQGLNSGSSALESLSRRELLEQQARQIELQNKLLQEQADLLKLQRDQAELNRKIQSCTREGKWICD